MAASGYAICPYCQGTVVPRLGADGRKVCPLCGNTGRPRPPAARQAPAPPPPTSPPPAPSPGGPVVPAPPRPTAPGALGSLICGIIGIVTAGLVLPGIVLGIIAIVLAGKARKAIAAEPGRFDGDGMATGGRVCGIIAIVLSVLGVLLAAVVFVLVANLATSVPDITFVAQPDLDRVVVTAVDDGVFWDELTVSGTAGCVAPEGEVVQGDAIQCPGDGTVVVRHAFTREVLFEGEV